MNFLNRLINSETPLARPIELGLISMLAVAIGIALITASNAFLGQPSPNNDDLIFYAIMGLAFAYFAIEATNLIQRLGHSLLAASMGLDILWVLGLVGKFPARVLAIIGFTLIIRDWLDRRKARRAEAV